jgi:hypothetical protein
LTHSELLVDGVHPGVGHNNRNQGKKSSRADDSQKQLE